jgi:hypothetical protein
MCNTLLFLFSVSSCECCQGQVFAVSTWLDAFHFVVRHLLELENKCAAKSGNKTGFSVQEPVLLSIVTLLVRRSVSDRDSNGRV